MIDRDRKRNVFAFEGKAGMHARGSLTIFSIAGLLATSLFGTSAFALEAGNSKLAETKPAPAKPLDKLNLDKGKSTQKPLEPVSKRFASADTHETPSFRQHVAPQFS
ncbi:MAG TPA: hypothetical protein VMR25_22185, partial [Planctomycetaceae bacterium]|nr:hypothetical protein [Planctomycetaceae bacterium]